MAEAAALLRVAPSTVRRWIREGDVPAYRVGRRRVALKRDDLSDLITPAGPGMETNGKVMGEQSWELRRLTPEEQQRAMEALNRAKRHAAEIQARLGAKLFPPHG